MKTNLAPKLIQNIDSDTVLLWFEKSNRYVVTSTINSNIIKLYTNPDESRDSFVANIHENYNLSDEEASALYDDITSFLEDVNRKQDRLLEQTIVNNAPSNYIEAYYEFLDKVVCIRYETELIQSIIHPQIAHHQVSRRETHETLFDIFKVDDTLHLLKNGVHVGSFKTRSFHFLQGRFALQLTNTIHDTNIDLWIAAFHASTITNGHESIMIIGDSGNGKSTLSVLLMANGFDILCDDFTPLYSEDMKLYRYPAATSIKKGAFDTLKSYVTNIESLKTHTNGPKKVNIKYVPPNQDPSEIGASFPCNKIVYVKYDADKDNTFNQISAGKILETLIPDSWISPQLDHAIKFMEWIKDVNCYELNYNHNDFAISKFTNLFNES